MHHTGSFIKLSHTFPTTGAVLGYSKAYRFHCSSSRISVVGGGGMLQTLTIQKLNILHRSIVIMTSAVLEKKEKDYVIVSRIAFLI